MAAAVDSTAGTLGHLTADEEHKLQEAWHYLLSLCGVISPPAAENGVNGNGTATTNGHTNGHTNGTDTNGHAVNGNSTSVTTNGHANGHHKQHHNHFWHHHHTPTEQDQHHDPVQFRNALWNFILADHPDVTVLRFLRARKWDVPLAMAMLVSAIRWRIERRLAEDILPKGDHLLTATIPGQKARAESELTADEKAFLLQYRSGKAYVRGHDRQGRPMFVVRVKLHDPKKQSGEVLENFVLHQIETIRLMMSGYPQGKKGGAEKAVLVFDLTGFGLGNMDFHIVKFLAQVFEARYPEYLGVVCVHNAPFIFWGIWKIIEPWLDPVVASKINFTKGSSMSSKGSMAPFIAPEHLQKRYGGTDAWEYEYIPPKEGENAELMSGPEKRREVEDERQKLVQRFEQITEEWAHAGTKTGEAEVAKAKAKERDELAAELSRSFWKLDPYVRARTYCHRAGLISDNGEADYQAAK